MKLNRNLLIIVGLTILSMSILIEQCYSQITFSNDWYGGKKRSSPYTNGLDQINNDHFLSNLFNYIYIKSRLNNNNQFLFIHLKDFVARLTSNENENISNAHKVEIMRRLIRIGSEYQVNIK